MSATRDKTQKIGFVYSNLYQLYKKGKDAAVAAPDAPAPSMATPPAFPPAGHETTGFTAPLGLSRGRVIKPGDLTPSGEHSSVKVKAYTPVAIIAPQKSPDAPNSKEPLYVRRPEALNRALASHQSRGQAVQGLKDSLKSMNDLHDRLRFMLKELEDLIKDKK